MTKFIPSPQQAQAITHRGGHLRIVACAGSGKTESLARRIASLVQEGIEPSEIVAFTFTEKAAAELKERVSLRIEESMGEEFLGKLGAMFVGTMHGYCFRMIQDHVPKYGNFDVLDEHGHACFLSREFSNIGLDKLGGRKWETIREFIGIVDVTYNELIPESELQNETLYDSIKAYEESLERFRFLTFGRIIALAVQEMKNTEVRQRVCENLKYLFVDEYQDVNPSQEALIHSLSLEGAELCVVGDDDQSIYQWRGADVDNIIGFDQRYSNVTTIALNENRRCVPGIVSNANTFAKSIAHRLTKEMKPHREDIGIPLQDWVAETPEDEAEVIAESIRQYITDGGRPRDIAVLFRSVRSSAPPLIEALARMDIPYECGGRTGLFLQPEIVVMAKLYAWFVDGEWREERYGEGEDVKIENLVEEFIQVWQPEEKADELKRYFEDWKKIVPKSDRPVNLIDDFYRLLRRLGVHRLNPDSSNDANRLGSLARFSGILADFDTITRRGRSLDEGKYRPGTDRGKDYYYRLYGFLSHYARDAYEDFAGEDASEMDAVSILTVHQAKGLEWPIVFLPCLTDGRFPSGRAGREREWKLSEQVFDLDKRSRYEGGDSEERRLFYVALTRARDFVSLSRFNRKKREFTPSPYMIELCGEESPELNVVPLPCPSQSSGSEEPPPVSVGFSELASFEKCGYRHRLSRSFGFSNTLVAALGYGRAVHHALRMIGERAKAGKETNEDDLETLLQEEFYLPFATEGNWKNMRKSVARMVSLYLGAHQEDLDRVWEVERPFELRAEDGLVAGRADVILDREKGKTDSLAIVDYKTAVDDRNDEAYEFQLAVYAAAGRGEGLDVNAAYLHELGSGVRREVPIGEEQTSAAIARLGELARKIRRGEFTPQPETDKCLKCDFRRICTHAKCDEWDLLY
jgi:DNA helicase-2/ATP-dependent DNA helicase PcrA